MLRIGVFGIGSVGSGLLKILHSGEYPIKVSKIVDRSFQHKKEIIGNIPSNDQSAFILDDPEIDLVVELIGGMDKALYIIREAIDKGKSVVTANKAVLAEHGYALFPKAKTSNLSLGFEAAVAGAIPIIHNLQTVFCNERIQLLQGILNGTSNYILTKMRTEKKDFSHVLKDAQNLGLAEADPALDINGMDACHKLALVSSLISGEWVDYKRISLQGIENLKLDDIEFASQLGYRIRLIGHYEKTNSGISIMVIPMMVASGNPLFHVEEENNAVFLKGEFSNQHLFQGKGAGSLPTASSVLADLVRIEKSKEPIPLPNFEKYAEIAPDHALECPFYLSFYVPDKPGILSSLTGCLAKEDISIHTALHSKKSLDGKDGMIRQILVVQKTNMHSIQSSLETMVAKELIVENPVYLPIDDEILLKNN
jgi:homoserine dehydrogenase